MRRITMAMVVMGLAGSAAVGQPATLEYIGQGIGLSDMSEDGTVVVGNTLFDGAYETWRWVRGDELGWQRLGAPTVPYLGTGAGSPDVSYDGTRASATIIDETGTLATCGIWENELGWTELVPPVAGNGIIVDSYYASAWGLSGDGRTLTGFYWYQGPTRVLAQPTKWTDGALIPLAHVLADKSARVNAANLDGSVCVGWSEAINGPWMPTVWRDGAATWLVPDLGTGNVSCMANRVNADGTAIVGQWYNPATARREPARWDWNGAGYDQTGLGVLPGTPQTWIANVFASSVSDDGSIITGINQFNANGPYSIQTGFVWTEEEGMRDIVDVMADLGVSFPDENWWVSGLSVSPDGSALGGTVLNTNTTGFLDYWSFMIYLTPEPACAGDVNGDGATDVFDFADLSANFGAGPGATLEQGDLTGDGFVDVFDFGELTADFGCDVTGS